VTPERRAASTRRRATTRETRDDARRAMSRKRPRATRDTSDDDAHLSTVVQKSSLQTARATTRNGAKRARRDATGRKVRARGKSSTAPLALAVTHDRVRTLEVR
jgi:hypothetical protein